MAEKQDPRQSLTSDELEAQQAAELPDREAMSLLDLNVDLGLGLDVAAPIDAAVAANANVAAPIDASVAANVGSTDSMLAPSVWLMGRRPSVATSRSSCCRRWPASASPTSSTR